MPFFSTKTYGCDRGLSCCYRNPHAVYSHCSQLHGYALGFKFTFGCENLDPQGWVMDFGGLKLIWAVLQENFDHTLVLAADDPIAANFHGQEWCNLKILPGVGCEAFALYVAQKTEEILDHLRKRDNRVGNTVFLASVEVFEHGANSAVYTPE